VANPLIDQGVLNRLRASVVFTNYPAMNVISANLGKEAIRLALEGNATSYLPVMTGAVPSPEPYQICTLTLNLVKSQPISNTYKTQFETTTLIGPAAVRPDAVSLGIYVLSNMVLDNVREMSYSGEDPVYVVTLKGTYQVNAGFFA
jgi:hypothetical protein